MRQSIGDGVGIGPAKPRPAPEIIPTTDALVYGETLYLQVGDLWLTGGRGDDNESVLTRSGEGGENEATYRWTLMQASKTVGSGPCATATLSISRWAPRAASSPAAVATAMTG